MLQQVRLTALLSKRDWTIKCRTEPGAIWCVVLGRIACTGFKDAAYCYRRSVVCLCVCLFVRLSVCLLGITMCCAKTAKPIDMFAVWTPVGPSNHLFIRQEISIDCCTKIFDDY